MPNQVNEVKRIEATLKNFLSRGRISDSSVTLDGMGVNAAYQYAILSLLGYDRLKSLKCLNVVSSSTFAVLFFIARREGLAAWSPDDLIRWDPKNRRMHKIIPLLTIAKFLLAKCFRRSISLDCIGFSKALQMIVKQDFFLKTVNDLPPNLTFFLYNIDDKKIETIKPGCHHLGAMKVGELIQAAPSVPGIFSPFYYQGKRYSDPVYCPQAKQMYKALKRESDNYLISNIYRESITKGSIYLKPHGYRDGRIPFIKDFLLFMCGLNNPEIFQVAIVGLKGVKMI